ncbi:MAG: hypothetical protein AAB317_01940 [Nitrospirota bacterium]
MSSVKMIFLGMGAFFLFSFQTAAHAGSLNLPSSNFAQKEFVDLSRELGLAISYVPAAPAEPLGIVGFDAGLEVTAVQISQDNPFWEKVAPSAPSLLPLPKIHLQKGLPFGIDLGLVYSAVPQLDLSVMGAEIKYAVIAGNVALPAVAIRGAYTKLSGVDTLDLSTMSLDLSVSKGFTFITPYAGVGTVQVAAKEKAGLGLKEVKENLTKGFAGVRISLAVINFVFEADFAEVPLYTLRVNVGL